MKKHSNDYNQDCQQSDADLIRPIRIEATPERTSILDGRSILVVGDDAAERIDKYSYGSQMIPVGLVLTGAEVAEKYQDELASLRQAINSIEAADCTDERAQVVISNLNKMAEDLRNLTPYEWFNVHEKKCTIKDDGSIWKEPMPLARFFNCRPASESECPNSLPFKLRSGAESYEPQRAGDIDWERMNFGEEWKHRRVWRLVAGETEPQTDAERQICSLYQQLGYMNSFVDEADYVAHYSHCWYHGVLLDDANDTLIFPTDVDAEWKEQFYGRFLSSLDPNSKLSLFAVTQLPQP